MAAKKRGRTIQWQHTRDTKGKKKYNGEASPYWDWMARKVRPNDAKEAEEYPTANPDVLAMPEDELPEVDTRELMRESVKIAKLSRHEKAVLNCIGLQGFTEEKTAKTLGMSRRQVRVHFSRAQKKCDKIFVAKMRHASVIDTGRTEERK